MEQPQELFNFLEHSGKDPFHLIFEDELTGIYNRRFLYQYLQSKVEWNALENRPFSLLMMDVDNFKRINDSYGHQIGDQALIWVTDLIKEVAGEDGLPIRYAGDEFMLLLQSNKQASLLRGEKLYRSVHEKSFHPSALDSPLRITLSIGVASAPEDAENGKALIQKADTALYSAKKKGRDCFVNASQVALEDVFDKTAIYQLEDVKLVGRKKQLAQVTNVLKKFGKKKSQFLIVEGSAGLGKTEFLESIRQSLARKKIWQVKVNGASQEMFRSYYLTTKILIDILNRRKDKGAKALRTLNTEQRSYLSQIIPQLGGDHKAAKDEDELKLREGIFTTLVHFIPKIVDRRPLIIFIDDLHFADEATMLLLRRMMLRGDIPLFICSTSSEGKEAKADKEKMILEAKAAASMFRGKAQAEIDQLKKTLEIIKKGGDAGRQTYLIENFERIIAPFAETLGFFPVDKLSVITGVEGNHEPISAIHPNAIAREKNDLIGGTIAAALGGIESEDQSADDAVAETEEKS